MKNYESLRNIAIIAHVDHGKTTLVDGLLRQSGALPQYKEIQNRVMDSNDLERERGITIFSKNTAINLNGVRINIIDTPGHADFSGEVERILKMVDGVLLIVDAYDGPMPQTRFVLNKALESHLLPIVVINKVDRPDARPLEVLDRIIDLFIDLGAEEEQLDFPVVYVSAKEGKAWLDWQNDQKAMDKRLKEPADLLPLLNVICEKVPCGNGDSTLPMKLLVSNLDYDDYVGRIAIGRIEQGTLKVGADVEVISGVDGSIQQAKVSKLLRFEALSRVPITEAEAGEIVCLAGIDDLNIGDTITSPEDMTPLPFVKIEEPSLAMVVAVNDSPFAGREGKYVTSRHLRERLYRETKRNIALQVKDGETTDRFEIKGRGELHLSVFIEEMRREGYEFKVGKPRVITKMIDGVLHEPEMEVYIEVPQIYVGIVIEALGQRKAELLKMSHKHDGYATLDFAIPARGLIGYNNKFMTDTKGTGILASNLRGYVPWKGTVASRGHGVLVAFESGTAVTYGLYHAQERGDLFVEPGTEVYEGMIVGTTAQPLDIPVNVCKKKHVTNTRACGSDDALRVAPAIKMSLEQSIEFLEDDEWLEVTPKSLRIRKDILNASLRAKAMNKQL